LCVHVLLWCPSILQFTKLWSAVDNHSKNLHMMGTIISWFWNLDWSKTDNADIKVQLAIFNKLLICILTTLLSLLLYNNQHHSQSLKILMTNMLDVIDTCSFWRWNDNGLWWYTAVVCKGMHRFNLMYGACSSWWKS
jgi:hypothetical protein